MKYHLSKATTLLSVESSTDQASFKGTTKCHMHLKLMIVITHCSVV